MTGSVLDRIGLAFALLAEPLAAAELHGDDWYTDANGYTCCYLCGARLEGPCETTRHEVGDLFCIRRRNRERAVSHVHSPMAMIKATPDERAREISAELRGLLAMGGAGR